MRLFFLCFAVVLCCQRVSAAPAKPQQMLDRKAADKLIQQLESKSFQVRQKASKALLELGTPVVPLLKEVAKSGTIEQAARAIKILGGLLRGAKDEKAIEAAEFALMELEDTQRPGIRSRALEALASSTEARHQFALKALAKLGGKVEYYQPNEIPNGRIVRIGPGGVIQQTRNGKKQIKQIKQIIIGNNWKGADDGLRHLRRLKSAPVVFITKGNGVTGKGIDKLKVALPATNVQLRGAAFLGVTMYTVVRNNQPGCQIRAVAPNSAAQKAGLNIGDTILTFDGKKTPGPDALIEIIGKYNPRDKVKLNVIRATGRAEILEVTLGGWGD